MIECFQYSIEMSMYLKISALVIMSSAPMFPLKYMKSRKMQQNQVTLSSYLPAFSHVTCCVWLGKSEELFPLLHCQ